MTEDDFRALSRDDKLNMIRFLIADTAAQLMSEDEETVQKARHELGNLAMMFMNMHYLATSASAESREMIRAIYNEYHSQVPTDSETGADMDV
jgi:hypothetical protein